MGLLLFYDLGGELLPGPASFAKLACLQDILDESQGYIKEDRVILEVSVKAEPPKNILTHKEFEKKIQDYKRIADIQCQRGLIDKAIECNSQALKFCKDKDPHCKADLEAQKAHLIDMKLKQSIERIEKGNRSSIPRNLAMPEPCS